jgi:hypothetical protein
VDGHQGASLSQLARIETVVVRLEGPTDHCAEQASNGKAGNRAYEGGQARTVKNRRYAGDRSGGSERSDQASGKSADQPAEGGSGLLFQLHSRLMMLDRRLSFGRNEVDLVATEAGAAQLLARFRRFRPISENNDHSRFFEPPHSSLLARLPPESFPFQAVGRLKIGSQQGNWRARKVPT